MFWLGKGNIGCQQMCIFYYTVSQKVNLPLWKSSHKKVIDKNSKNGFFTCVLFFCKTLTFSESAINGGFVKSINKTKRKKFTHLKGQCHEKSFQTETVGV